MRILYRDVHLSLASKDWVRDVQLVKALQSDRSKGEMVRTLAMAHSLGSTPNLQNISDIQDLFNCIRPVNVLIHLGQDDLPVLDLLNARACASWA